MEAHLAQYNIARMRAPLDHPAMASFVARLAGINAIADASPGFIWRLQTAGGDATAIRVPEDERMLVNLTVWESIEALEAYAYRAGHGAALNRRDEWFEPIDGDQLVLWWVEAGHRPSLREARSRLEMLCRFGPAPDAFTFRHRFEPPGA